MIKLVVICGATAVGKTDLSIKLAKHYNSDIINADASQFRRGLNIGTAKITKEEMDGVKHHLIDIISPIEDFSIYDYQVKAREVIDNIKENSKPIFVVGGSGLYIDALINDYKLDTSKSIHDDKYDSLSDEELFNKLKEINPLLASHSHVNNRKRNIRYLERALEGDSYEEVHSKPIYDALYLFINRDRDVLYDRINKRVDVMIDNGWIDEVNVLKNNNVNLSKVKEIGYSLINDYLDNKITIEEVKEEIRKQTRHYAKRQITWFKNKTDSHVIDIDNCNIDDIYNLIDGFIGNNNER